MENNQTNTNYDAAQIQVLEGLTAVRKRPGMYVGGTDTKALHHLVFEVVDNAIDEALAGFCDEITVTLHPDASITISDNGRGIPIDIHPTKGISALEVVLTTLHAGGKFGGGSYKVSGGLHGVGSSAVNALSEWMEARVYRGGKIYYQRYAQGVPQERVKVIGDCPEEKTGTEITFRFDPTIFADDAGYKYEILFSRFREMAFVTKQTKIRLVDEASGRNDTFYFQGGISSFVHYLNRNVDTLHPVVAADKTINGIGIEVAFQYREDYTETIFTFANTINTHDGGTHLTGLRTGITRVINDYARSANLLKDGDSNFTGEDTREGLTAVINVKHPDPQFESQTKVKLMNTEVATYAQQVIVEVFKDYLEHNPSVGKAIVAKCQVSTRAREAAKKARETIIKKSVLESLTLPGKLADCSSRDATKTELFIVEGDSAGGSAKQGRDRSFQAILPLRGKILNIERSTLDKILGNNEIKSLISAIGTGINENFNLGGLRYGKIIIMTDADVDGSHIRTLLLTFFFRFMPEIIDEGHLFIAQPPLFRISLNKNAIHYAYSDAQRDQILSDMGKSAANATITRYKGLGEMNASLLWETTMDPAIRTLFRVKVEDSVNASKTFDMLMGAEVPPRTRFIQTHAHEVRNLDI